MYFVKGWLKPKVLVCINGNYKVERTKVIIVHGLVNALALGFKCTLLIWSTQTNWGFNVN